MRSPTNSILTGLAIADLCVMIDYIPFALHSGDIGTGSAAYEKYSKPWTVYIFLHAFISQNLHTISIFLTVILAIWRYIAVAFPQKNRVWCDMNNTLIAIVCSYILTPIITIPSYFTIEIMELERLFYPNGTEVEKEVDLSPDFLTENHINNMSLYVITRSKLSLDHPSLISINFFIYSGELCIFDLHISWDFYAFWVRQNFHFFLVCNLLM